MKFFLSMIPPTVTAQQKGVNFVARRVYTKDEVKDAYQALAARLSQHRPQTPLSGAVRLTTKWCFPANGKHEDGEYKTSRPDTDNSLKLLKDAMTDLGFWGNDAQVASEVTEKFWAVIPGIFIEVEPLSGGSV